MRTFEDDTYRKRQLELSNRMREQKIDLFFCPPSADLEYLTGTLRRKPTFGNISYTHGWVCGAFFRPFNDPLFVLPRMVAEFDMPHGATGEKVIVNETDDGSSVFEKVIKNFGPMKKIAVEERTWAETIFKISKFSKAKIQNSISLTNPMRRIKTPEEISFIKEACLIADISMEKITNTVAEAKHEREISEELDHLLHLDGSRGVSFDTAVWAMGKSTTRDADDREKNNIIPDGSSLLFDFGAIINGYCSDFGRTLAVGEPDGELKEVYEIVIESARQGLLAVKPGALASEVDRATRKVIEDAGYGDKFRHRTGHCIGLDVHEYPFISEEDDTPLEAGMTFTIEPSIFWPGNVGARIEDIILVTENGGEKLNQYHEDFVTVEKAYSRIQSEGGCAHDDMSNSHEH
jgi:Xaa-Pro dipeptidase|tara:strand:+ start:242 stop:1456 length:1215 start_codon:yes stop_codon:yes gene_type:complete